MPEATALARPGCGKFRFPDEHGTTGALDVHFYRPARFGPASPILFVVHGRHRNAVSYRQAWAPVADRYGCLLLCPEFSRASYPRADFQLGRVLTGDGLARRREEWTFDVVERIFDAVRSATGNATAGYHIYGHSAGAQFVHRLALVVPGARFAAAAAANAGWYTMPTLRQDFPYGLGSTGLTARDLREALARRLIVLLASEDVDTDDPYLRNSAGARIQGRNRLARGLAFHAAGGQAAARLGVRRGWELVTVPGARHRDQDMMPAAARALFGGR
jgi:hypothetical protein